ncbi:MAG: hypothetical protein AVDCRST_MAG37-575 [uncultured Rubrobacteraceae bacterium]|uniref:Alkaline shock response membrane anchor protein AmaP n=1 Tax=uncultured Rubrobacteraceae bacterium TaxID=349277 RepID=A0A6J4Q1U5_9ACTN|nr:MAG: hypothetical protein AVDCRST_MAG37-575 [uncultured Rubrobacteraceae bacterium]
MNGFNRLIMLILALLLIAAPVFLLLIGLGVFSADQINSYTNYRGGLDALGRISVSDFTDLTVKLIVGLVVALLTLLAGYLLLRELTFGRRLSRRALLEDEPGRETAITATAVRHLAEGAARESGAASPTCRLASDKNRYEVGCDIRVPASQNFTEISTNSRDNIRRVLEEQQVPLKNVEVTVQGTAPQG